MERIKKREQDQTRKEYIQQKGYKTIEMWESEWWSLYKTDASVKSHLREDFTYRRSLGEEGLMQRILDGRPFGYVQCNAEVPEHLRDYLSNFPPIIKNTIGSRNYIGKLMKEYAKKDGIMPQPRRMLISNGIIITPLLLFFLKLGLVCKKIHWFVRYTPRKSFDNFIQSGVDARRQGVENRNSSVVSETMRLLANNSYGYQIMDCSRHRLTKYLTDEKTHSAINRQMFKRLNHITDQL